MEINRRSSTYNQLLNIPAQPTFLEAIQAYLKKVGLWITSALGAIIITLVDLIYSSPKFIHILYFIGGFVVISIIVALIIFIIKRTAYFKILKRKELGLRDFLLFNSGVIEPQNCGDLSLVIIGISEDQGNVNIVIDEPLNCWLNIGAKLDLLSSVANTCWGTIEVIRIEDRRAFGFPIDRTNPEFWESLEDRMRTDSSPPTYVHLEPHVPEVIRRFFENPERLGEKRNG